MLVFTKPRGHLVERANEEEIVERLQAGVFLGDALRVLIDGVKVVRELGLDSLHLFVVRVDVF